MTDNDQAAVAADAWRNFTVEQAQEFLACMKRQYPGRWTGLGRIAEQMTAEVVQLREAVSHRLRHEADAVARAEKAERERDEARRDRDAECVEGKQWRARYEQAMALLREWREDDGLPAATHTSKRGRTDAFLAGQPAPEAPKCSHGLPWWLCSMHRNEAEAIASGKPAPAKVAVDDDSTEKWLRGICDELAAESIRRKGQLDRALALLKDRKAENWSSEADAFVKSIPADYVPPAPMIDMKDIEHLKTMRADLERARKGEG